MKTMKFECTLLTDVILNQKAATEGGNNTLDFIPGNAFLGIAASRYDEYTSAEASEIFHSGRVRFGDAHPAYSKGGKAVRTLRVPASYFYPKLKTLSEACYVHHQYERSHDTANDGSPQQLKQSRAGFYAFSGGEGVKMSLETSFAIKSAYDRTRRRSMDEKMYGYESLDAGAVFLFEVEAESDELAGRIKESLIGRRRIGRSRTAQYGLVEIKEAEYEDVKSSDKTFLCGNDKCATVYADSRLIFLDRNDEPTLQPTAEDLGIDGGTIIWEKSQVRTFQYAPWNGKRMTRDAERFGIEKGSVFVVRLEKDLHFESRYVGVYRNEGFGKVIYNPAFLDVKEKSNGEATTKIIVPFADSKEPTETPVLEGTPLLDFVRRKRDRQSAMRFIYEKVNAFVSGNGNAFNSGGERFASQWGAIRGIAQRKKDYNAIWDELFEANGYLVHGVAEEQWRKRRRIDLLKEFVKEIHDEGRLYGDLTSEALVNLSSEMAKIK